MSMIDIRTRTTSPTAIRFGCTGGGTGRITNAKETCDHMGFSLRTNDMMKVGYVHYEDIQALIDTLELIKSTWKQAHPLRAEK